MGVSVEIPKLQREMPVYIDLRLAMQLKGFYSASAHRYKSDICQMALAHAVFIKNTAKFTA